MFLEPDSSHIHPSGEDTASQETSGGWVEFVQMTDSSKKTFQESAKAILPIDACTGIVFLNPYNPEACSLTTKAIAAMLGGNWDDQSLVRWGSRITEFKQTNWKKLTKDFKKHLGLASKSKEAGRQTSELKTVSTFLSLDHARIVCDGEQTLRIYEGTPRRDFEGIKDLLACLSFDEEMSLTLLKSDGRMVVVKADSCLLDTQKSMPQAHLILIETSRSKAQALPKTG